MVRNIHEMTSKEMEFVCRSMTDSFMDYEMTGTNLGMLEANESYEIQGREIKEKFTNPPKHYT